MASKRPPYHSKQAEKIADRFGGVQRLAKAVKRRPAVVYKWTYPRAKGGTGGLIPSSAVPDVIEAAEALDITLSDRDWRP